MAVGCVSAGQILPTHHRGSRLGFVLLWVPFVSCVSQNFVLPQEMIIEVEGEDAGSLDIMPQESTDFKIVTVDLTEEGQSTWNNAQRTPEKTVILEGHRDLWGEY